MQGIYTDSEIQSKINQGVNISVLSELAGFRRLSDFKGYCEEHGIVTHPMRTSDSTIKSLDIKIFDNGKYSKEFITYVKKCFKQEMNNKEILQTLSISVGDENRVYQKVMKMRRELKKK